MVVRRPSLSILCVALAASCAPDAPPTDCAADPLAPACAQPEPPFPGLSAPLRIVRDQNGAPHVFGATDADVSYGSGYMQTYDRAFEMELTRRRALGTRAEVLGARYTDDDELVRVIGIGHWGRVNAATILREDPEAYALLVAWCAGVNARLAELRSGEAPMPAEMTELGITPADWTPGDAMAVGKLLLFGNANQLEYDILSTIIRDYLGTLSERLPLIRPVRDAFTMPPDERPTPSARDAEIARPRGLPAAMPADARARFARFTARMDAFRSGGSNNWAVEGRHTDTGRPYIAGDPHQPLQSPSLFWLHGMHASAGQLDVVGFSFVGSPGVQLGHNRHLAWTATTTYPDMMDLYDVRVTTDAMGEVVSVNVAGVEHAARVRHEEVIVREGRARDVEIVEVPGVGVLLPTGIAPIPLGRSGRRLLFRWTGFRPTHEALGFGAIDTARTLEDFEAAVDRMELGCFNFVGATADGIAYRSGPLVPRRGDAGAQPYTLLDGDDPALQWTGEYLSAAQQPHSRGGARGFIATANNDPFGFTSDASVLGDPWYYGVYFDPGTRGARIESELERLIADPAPITREAMMALQHDTRSLFADDLVPVLLETWDATSPTDATHGALRSRADLEVLVEALRGWDRSMVRDASEPVIFQGFAFLLTAAVLADDLGLVFDPVLQSSSPYILKWASLVVRRAFPAADSFMQEGRDALVFAALEQTATWLTARFGASDPASYAWRDLHGTLFRGIHGARLDAGWFPTDGADGTVNVSDTSFFDGSRNVRERLESTGGSIYRFVAGFDADGTPRASFQMARGVSGDPESEHWDDLHDDWIEGRYRTLLFHEAEIMMGPTEELTLMP